MTSQTPRPGSTRPLETLAARNPTAVGTALALLRRHPHWHFFPIAPGTKDRPMVKDNLASGATNNPTIIRSWSVACNVGLALAKSEVIAVDVDRKPGKNGAQTFYDLEFRHGGAEHDAFPATFKVLTPSKGWHLYYRGEHKFALGKHGFGEGIDSPNYVLVPGSVLADGGNYTVIANAPIAEAPAWFGEYLKDKETVEAEQTPVIDLDQPVNIEWTIHYLEQDAPPSIQLKSGEKMLLDVAGVLKDRGISEGMAIELLAEYYNARCQPPWSLGDGPIEDRLDIKVHNAFFAYLENRRSPALTRRKLFSQATSLPTSRSPRSPRGGRNLIMTTESTTASLRSTARYSTSSVLRRLGIRQKEKCHAYLSRRNKGRRRQSGSARRRRTARREGLRIQSGGRILGRR